MSKVVKSIGRAVTKVVKGAIKIATSGIKATVGAVKKLAKSKLGKIILIAAAVYFGGAALMGGFGSTAAGGSFLSGMGTGVANAATSLSTAWSSAMAGNFSAAGSSLSAGIQGTTTALQAANAGALTAGMSQAQMLASQNAGISGATAATNSAAATAFPASAAGAGAGGGSTLALTPQAAAASGIGEGMMGAAKITAGTQLVGGLIQGAGAQKAQDEQRKYEAEQAQAAKDSYNANVGTRLWGDAQTTGYEAQAAGAAAYDPVAEARAVGERSRAEFDARYGGGPAQVGMIGRSMAAAPMTNNNFPVYNPAYYRG